MSEPSERIFLQWDGDEDPVHEGMTWCVDRINNTDIEYIRLDLHDAQIAELEKHREALRAFITKHEWKHNPPYDAMTEGVEHHDKYCTCLACQETKR